MSQPTPGKPDTLTIRDAHGRPVATLEIRRDRHANRLVGSLSVSPSHTAEFDQAARRPSLVLGGPSAQLAIEASARRRNLARFAKAQVGDGDGDANPAVLVRAGEAPRVGPPIRRRVNGGGV